MSKVTFVKPGSLEAKDVAAKDIPSRRIRQADGSTETVYMLETTDPDFGAQFQKVFRLNVARARRSRPPRSASVAAE